MPLPSCQKLPMLFKAGNRIHSKACLWHFLPRRVRAAHKGHNGAALKPRRLYRCHVVARPVSQTVTAEGVANQGIKPKSITSVAGRLSVARTERSASRGKRTSANDPKQCQTCSAYLPLRNVLELAWWVMKGPGI